ncbi:hypothetical protein ACFW04_013738 [Cataglyphis niger]
MSSTTNDSSPTILSGNCALIRVLTHHIVGSPLLEEELCRYWEIEKLPRQTHLTLHEKQCEEHFRSTHSHDSDGRYIVRLSNVTITRLRVVFNVLSVTSNGTSLNGHLNAGPKLQTDRMSVILQWHRYRYIYSSDIAKMYRQIRIDSRDISYQRILWKSSFSEPLIDYQLLTVTYGMSCAPFLALRGLKQLVID